MIRQSLLVLALAGVSAFAQAPAQQPARDSAQGPPPRGVWDNVAPPPVRPVAPAERKAPAMPVMPPAATAPARPQPVVELPPDMLELHQQAVELMRARTLAEAGPIMEKIGKAVPPQQRGRAFTINRTILDLGQKRLLMRGVKELGDYLIKNRAEDEYATNVLGGALNIAARDPSLKKGALWQAAFTEWDRRNYVLDHSRPGYHRWGTKWLTEEENNDLKAKKQAREDAIAKQYERITQLWSNFDAKRREYETLVRNTPVYGFGPYQGGNLVPGQNQQPIDPNLYQQQMANQRYQQLALEQSADEVTQVANEYKAAIMAYNRMENTIIAPEWPTSFDPVDATENIPPPIVLPAQRPKTPGNDPVAQPKP
jgi:hypothetical protein